MKSNIKWTEELNNKKQCFKGKTKLKFKKMYNWSIGDMIYHRQNGTFQFEEDLSAANAQSIGEKSSWIIHANDFFTG